MLDVSKVPIATPKNGGSGGSGGFLSRPATVNTCEETRQHQNAFLAFYVFSTISTVSADGELSGGLHGAKLHWADDFEVFERGNNVSKRPFGAQVVAAVVCAKGGSCSKLKESSTRQSAEAQSSRRRMRCAACSRPRPRLSHRVSQR